MQPQTANPAPINPVGPVNNQPPAPVPAVEATDFNTKVFEPKVLLAIIGIDILYALLRIFPILALIVWIAAVVYTYKMVSKYKAQQPDVPVAADRQEVTVLMAIDPVVAQAIFYYRLHKVHPNMAKVYNRYGWKVFGVEVLFAIILNIFFVALLSGTK